MTGEAPPRPDATARMRRVGPARRWLPTIGVLGAVIATTLGGFIVAAMLSAPAGPPVSIPGVVSVQPLTGWEPARPGSVGQRPFVRVTRGSGTLAAVSWGPFTQGPEQLAVAVRDQVLSDSFDQLTVSEELTPVAFDDGSIGQRFTFVGVDRASGSSVEGEVTTAVSSDGRGVAFIGFSSEGLLAFVDDDLRAMVSAAVVGPAA